MPSPKDDDPPVGYWELCAKLRTEKDPVKFRAVVEEINRLLTDYEKSEASQPHENSTQQPSARH